MADNPLLVELLKEYKDEANVTRTEVAEIIGTTRSAVAGICNRNGVKPWPAIPLEVRNKRSCVFPIGRPGEAEFHLCDKAKASGHLFLCEEHTGKVWVPTCKILALPTKAKTVEPPVETPPETTEHLSEAPVAEVVPTHPLCVWPLSGSHSLKETATCDTECVPGERFCVAHLALVRRYANSR